MTRLHLRIYVDPGEAQIFSKAQGMTAVASISTFA